MADELHKVERKALHEAVDPWKAQVQALREAIFTLYTPFIGAEISTDQAILLATRITQMLDELEVDPMIDAIVLQAVSDAHALGMKIARRGSDAEQIPDLPVSDASLRAVVGMATRAQDAITQAKVKLTGTTSTSTLEGLMAAVKPVMDSPVQMQRATTWATNNAKNSAIAEVAKITGESLCWVPERSSCLHCAAYAGVYASKEGFPKGLTFMEKPLVPKGHLFSPPLHPNCRCDVEIGLTPDYAAALKREAIREVLRGTSLDSVSDAAKIRAAQRLLEKEELNAPASVQKYAKDAVKRGTFKPKKKAPKKNG